MTHPEPPQNIRLEYPSGEVVPLEAVYTGVDLEGDHRWEVTLTLGSRHTRALICGDAQVRVDMMPAHTGITLHLGGLFEG